MQVIFIFFQAENMSEKYSEIIALLRSKSNPEAIAGMARYGINPANLLGIQIPVLRELAKKYRFNHQLALELWASGIHELRILASMIDDPKQVDTKQMEQWISEFDSWDVCDQVIMNLFEKHPEAYQKAVLWSRREAEFEKRAGFVMMARLAVSDKIASDEKFTAFFPCIIEGASDQRNMVKKAVNWAVRQIGKRNMKLNDQAVALSEKLLHMESKAARWIAADAIRELKNEKIRSRLK
jgi:3-methyladenine DNA glycosylase AlkD